ncbi:MAG: hypothetical protein R2758_08205 [Bacteroidales bacterium]
MKTKPEIFSHYSYLRKKIIIPDDHEDFRASHIQQGMEKRRRSKGDEKDTEGDFSRELQHKMYAQASTASLLSFREQMHQARTE